MALSDLTRSSVTLAHFSTSMKHAPGWGVFATSWLSLHSFTKPHTHFPKAPNRSSSKLSSGQVGPLVRTSEAVGECTTTGRATPSQWHDVPALGHHRPPPTGNPRRILHLRCFNGFPTFGGTVITPRCASPPSSVSSPGLIPSFASCASPALIPDRLTQTQAT